MIRTEQLALTMPHKQPTNTNGIGVRRTSAKEPPLLNHLVCDVHALKTTTPTVLLEFQGLVLGHAA